MHRKARVAALFLAGALLFTAVPAYAEESLEAITDQATGCDLATGEIAGEESELNAEVMATVEAALAAAEAEAKAEEDAQYADIGVAVVNDYVNIRKEASTSADIVGRLVNGAVATVESESDGWYKVTSGSISGYVKAEYLVVGDADLVKSVQSLLATVETTSLKLREKASTSATVLTMVTTGDQLEVIDEDTDGWVHVSYDDYEGYVSADYVTVENTYVYAKKPEEVSGGSAVATYALQFVGNPYKWGGTSLTNGADCSGFVMSVYAHFGISLPHSSSALRNVGTAVSYSEAKPGDIICYSGHVAIYIGNGQIVHAANTKKGIIVSSATYRSIISVRRIFN